MVTATLSLSADVPEPRLAQLTRDVRRDLSKAGIQARAVEAAAAPGERGADTFGQLALELVTSGAVTALIECLKAYISRERTLCFEFTRPDGAHVEVNAKNVDTETVRKALEAAARSAGGRPANGPPNCLPGR